MYRIQWNRRALARLPAIWVGATDRNAVTTASTGVDQALAQNAENVGESRPGNRRVMYVSPLGIRFKVYPDRNLVRVLACWQIRQV